MNLVAITCLLQVSKPVDGAQLQERKPESACATGSAGRGGNLSAPNPAERKKECVSVCVCVSLCAYLVYL